jgi:hypothetical protein
MKYLFLITIFYFFIENDGFTQTASNYIETETINEIIYMNKNLSSVNFRNGDKIHLATSKADWLDACRKDLPSCCFYNFDPKMEKNGLLYNYSALTDQRNIAPIGFRLMNENDLLPNNLSIIMHGGTYAGQEGDFFGINEFTLFWSLCTESDSYFNKYCYWKILPEDNPIFFENFPEYQGMFVRCIKE